MNKIFVFNGKSGQEEYYQVFKNSKYDRSKLVLKHKTKKDTVNYRFYKTKEYNSHSDWDNTLCEKLQTDILSGVVKAKIVNQPAYIIKAKHFSDGNNYFWKAKSSLVKKINVGDCIWVETSKGDKLAFVLKVFKFDLRVMKIPEKRAKSKCNKEIPFISKKEYIDKKINENNKKEI